MIRAGLVGFGMGGRVFHAPLLSSVEGLELAAVVERSTDNAAARYPGITTYRTLEEMLGDKSLELFVVTTPSGTHFEVARQILTAGKSVVVDKPTSVTSAEVAHLMELAAAHGTYLFPFHNRRWDSDFRTIQKLLDEGPLGRLVHFQSAFDRWRPVHAGRAWKDDPAQGGGATPRSSANETARAQSTPSRSICVTRGSVSRCLQTAWQRWRGHGFTCAEPRAIIGSGARTCRKRR
jgi:predicted dehydrogenase